MHNLLKGKNSLRFSFTVQNVAIVTKYSGIDPEIFNGIDNNVYPRPRNFMFGLNLNFD
jgi:iron complex outermembrane receptor protein